MKRKLSVTLLLGTILGAVVLSGTAFAAETSKSDEKYTIPAELTPLSKWANGFTAEEAQRFRTTYQATDFFAGNDVTAYALLHISEVIPTMVVARSGQVSQLESNPMPEIGKVTAKTELGTMTLDEAIADPRARLQGIAVVHKGKLVYEAYPGMPRGAKHVWSSTTKTVTGVLLHQLAAEGLIDLKAPVSSYLDFMKGKPIGDVSVGDVLHMRSGLDYEENQANRLNPKHPVSWGFVSSLSARGVPAGKSIREIIEQTPAIDPPNTVFSYSTFNTQVLSMVIEKVTGKPWNEVFSERIWSKVGMEGDGLLGLSPAGEPLAGGVFAATLRDLARYAMLFTPSWNVVTPKRVIPEDYFAAVAAASDPKIYGKGEMGKRMNGFFAEVGAPTGASYHWDAVWEDGDLYKSGMAGQAIYVSPSTDTAIVWFSTTWQSAFPLTPYLRAIVNQVFRKEAADAQPNDKAPAFAIKDFINGGSAEDQRRFKQEFGVASSLTANPTAAWFHNFTSRALPTAVIPRRQPTMPPRSKIIPEIGKVTATTAIGEMDLNTFLEHPKSFAQGFIVVHKGKIVFEQYPGMREENSHMTASTAKVLVGLLVERLIEEGAIDEQKTLGDYVPEFRGSAWAPIKVIDVMDMSTGLDPIDAPEHFVNPDAVITRMVMAELGETYKGKVESMLEVMKEAKAVSKPGAHFTYSSTATQALVVLTEAVTKQTWADAFDQRIWSKMGVDGALQVHLSPEGYALGHGVLSLRLRDLARFGMLYTPSWKKIAVEPVVTPEILARARVPYRSREFYRNGPSGKKFMDRLGDDSVRSAGRQWDAVWDDGDFFKSGMNTQGIYVSPVRDLVIAYFSLEPTQQLQKYLRPLVTSGLFDR